MRASTVRCRVLDRCGDSLGVETSFKDICILAAVLNSTCRSKFGPYVRASLRGAVMGLFRDRRDRRDLSLKACWTLAVWLMTQQLRCDVNEADEAEQRRLERHPESGHAVAVLAAARLASDGEHLATMACEWRMGRMRGLLLGREWRMWRQRCRLPRAWRSHLERTRRLRWHGCRGQRVRWLHQVLVSLSTPGTGAMSLDPVRRAESMATAWFRCPRSRRPRGWIGACRTGNAPFVVTRPRCRNKWTCAASAMAPGGNLVIDW